MPSTVTTADKILIAATGCLVVVSFLFARSMSEEGSVALVQVDRVIQYKLPLHEARSVSFRGTYGPVTIETRDGKIAVTEATCPNHICVRTGWQSRAGEVIVCVPNKTVVRIVSQENKTVRATTG